MSHAAANEESSKKDVIFAIEIEETVQAINEKTGIQLAGFVEYFQNKWLLGKLKIFN